MNMELRSIASKGDLAKERITFRVRADLDVGDYAFMQTGFFDDEITTTVYNTFWFPYKPVAKGDLVVLYTRKGTPSSKPLRGQGHSHFFFMGLDRAIWNNLDKGAVLLEAASWQGMGASQL
ncbi:hypothetical protein [Blastomonas fulva]|jgi:hypothetical protein|uniref:hypothetical protein n=1 Tax=Blastomonas fulva TaxID=1550728 RepID=UPI003D2A0BB4